MKKTIVIVFAVLVILFSSFVSAGDYIIRSGGNDLVIADTSGNLNVTTGNISEGGILLEDIYWAIADAATPNTGDTTHVSTAGQIFAYIVGLDYVAAAWNSLANMTLTDGSIYIGDASNNPAAQAISGDIALTNAGVVTLNSDVVGDDALNTTQVTLTDFTDDVGYFTDIANFTGTLTDTKSCTYSNAGTEIVCDTTQTTGTVTSIATTGPIAGGTITATGTISLTACGDGEYYLYNTTSAAWACEVETLGGMQDLVDDVIPQLGGSLDVNGFNITDAAGTASIMINTSGVIITI